MALFHDETLFEEIEAKRLDVNEKMKDSLIGAPFLDDFSRRFCWSSNAIEGNTLSLDETVAFIDFDEVRSGHSYSEYQDTKALYRAICSQILPLEIRNIDEVWIKKANAILLMQEEEYRQKDVYIGTTLEAVYYPPSYTEVPNLMKKFVQQLEIEESDIPAVFEKIAKNHMDFERIHPFSDGNGRTGRMILNQQLVNQNFLPIIIEAKGDYRQAFRRYDRNGDVSQMVHIIAKGELASMERVMKLYEKRNGIEI